MTDAHHTEAQPCRGLPFPEPEDVFAARKGIVQEARRIVAEAGYELSAQNVMTVIVPRPRVGDGRGGRGARPSAEE
ncbi:unnamed protein product [Vitrella brassicaformis CCMP3155]|uniref:Uncharacterized protein n=1 Tax=Vitrella brassicaformis (strain CCMP3155) TaxID=1169540 RepID=A0A0G4ER98_VITBC|nr:unnamed protein product [Vitrella brassicaformis CCMP3155]|eukprot:CEM00778.1 unnamed protein product [Vitrella brassicaformis CCMP3155]